MRLETENRSYRFLMSVKEQLRKEQYMYQDITLPIQKGDVLGEYHLYLGEQKMDTIPLTAGDFADVWDFFTVLKVVVFQFFCVFR